MPRAIKIIGGLTTAMAMMLAVAVGYLSWRIANPSAPDLLMAESLVSADTEAGRIIRARAIDRSDLDLLDAHFEGQQYATYCGVASSVIALNALGTPITQDTFFDGLASDVHGRWSTFYGGMSVDQLGELLAAHGTDVEVVHAGNTTVDAFRRAARDNLAREGDVVLVNYLRSAIDQISGGHISPLGAYDVVTDRFLILDVSTYKYPPVWVTAEALFGAMNTGDSESGTTRGYVLVAKARRGDDSG